MTDELVSIPIEELRTDAILPGNAVLEVIDTLALSPALFAPDPSAQEVEEIMAGNAQRLEFEALRLGRRIRYIPPDRIAETGSSWRQVGETRGDPIYRFTILFRIFPGPIEPLVVQGPGLPEEPPFGVYQAGVPFLLALSIIVGWTSWLVGTFFLSFERVAEPIVRLKVTADSLAALLERVHKRTIGAVKVVALAAVAIVLGRRLLPIRKVAAVG